MKAFRFAAICALGIGGLSGILSLVFVYGDWKRLALVVVIGIFIGLAMAPELKPKLFKAAWKIQICSGIAAGGIVGWFINPSPDAIFLGTLIGGVLGWQAPSWIKHAPLP